MESVFLVVLLCNVFAVALSNNCEFVGYDSDAKISPYVTLKNCTDRVNDIQGIPVGIDEDTKIPEKVTVYTNLRMNSMVELDAIKSRVSLDFYLYLHWTDTRLAMPNFWDKVSEDVKLGGIPIDDPDIFHTIWKPDIFFYDGLNIQEQGKHLSINSESQITYSRHLYASFTQPHFQFKDFPQDKQSIRLRYGSYKYDSTFLDLDFTQGEKSLSFESLAEGVQSNFFLNSEWENDGYESSNTCKTQQVNSTYTKGMTNFTVVECDIAVERYTVGFETRLLYPIIMMLVLTYATFYIGASERIARSTGLLITLSGFYIAALANVPFTGYITIMDEFILRMIFLIAIIIVIHIVHMMIHRFIYTDTTSRMRHPLWLYVALLWWQVRQNVCKLMNNKTEVQDDKAYCMRKQMIAISLLPELCATRLLTDRISLNNTEKERKYRILTTLMLLLQTVGRVFTLPFIVDEVVAVGDQSNTIGVVLSSIVKHGVIGTLTGVLALFEVYSMWSKYNQLRIPWRRTLELKRDNVHTRYREVQSFLSNTDLDESMVECRIRTLVKEHNELIRYGYSIVEEDLREDTYVMFTRQDETESVNGTNCKWYKVLEEVQSLEVARRDLWCIQHKYRSVIDSITQDDTVRTDLLKLRNEQYELVVFLKGLFPERMQNIVKKNFENLFSLKILSPTEREAIKPQKAKSDSHEPIDEESGVDSDYSIKPQKAKSDSHEPIDEESGVDSDSVRDNASKVFPKG